MTSLKFERPIGAKADVAELKYVSALHQTSDLRPDGSIHQTDISALLASKFGLQISDEEVQQFILRGLSTGSRLIGETSDDDDTNNEIFDLCEVVAALAIPELLVAAEYNDGEQSTDDLPQDMLGRVLETITKTAFGNTPNHDDLIINTETVKRILISLGEDKLAQNDDLVCGMVRVAIGGDGDDASPKPLNSTTFARALTSDIQSYQNGDTSYSRFFGLAEKQSALGLFRRRMQVSSESVQRDESSDVEEGDAKNNEKNASIIKTSVKDKTESQENVVETYWGKRIFTAPSIDYFIDAQASRSIAVCLWLFLLLYILASGFFGMQDFPSLVPSDVCPPEDRNVGCDTVEVLLSWVDSIVTILIVGGIFIMLIGSAGNRVDASRVAVIVSLIPVLYFFIKPFTSIGSAPEDFSGEYHRQFALGLSMVIAVVIVVERVRQLAHLSATPKQWLNNSCSRLSQIFTRGFTGTECERLEAASHKVNRMLHNAFDVISPESTKTSQQYLPESAVVAFYEGEDKKEKVGGHLWVWKRMKNRSLYQQEGIRFSARLLAANITQYFIIIYIILFIMVSTEQFMESYDGSTVIILVRSAQSTATNMINSIQDLRGTASMAVETMFTSVFPALDSLRLNACGALASAQNDTASFDVPEICYSNNTYLSDLQRQSEDFKALILTSLSLQVDPIKNFLNSAIDAAADTLADTAVIVDPLEPWMIQMAFGVGGLIGFCASIFLATLYLPSVTSTMLRFRCGILPSLTADPKRFSDLYRNKLHHISFLTGALFWGTVLYVAILAFVIAFIILAAIWLVNVLPVINENSDGPGVWGYIIGSVVAFVAQFALFNLCTCAMYDAFYRRRPGRANLHSLLWEAAWIALSVLFVASRAIKLTIVAALQIGRIDIPFLADGVGVYGSFQLDRFPDIFRQDILAHEAHNHPFIERLSKIYLLKMHCGNDFANDAGTGWRLIFVLSLFPWLRQHRVNNRLTPNQPNERETHKMGCQLLFDCLD